MKSGEYSTRDAIQLLVDNGFKLHRKGKGDHMIYIRGSATISLPTAKKSVNRMMFKRLCKENNICMV